MTSGKEKRPKKKDPLKTFYARDKGGIEYSCQAVNSSEAGFLFSQAFDKIGLNFFVDVREFYEVK